MAAPFLMNTRPTPQSGRSCHRPSTKSGTPSAQTKLFKSTIFALQKKGIFPASIKIGPKASAWFEDEVQHYIETRPRFGRGRKE